MTTLLIKAEEGTLTPSETRWLERWLAVQERGWLVQLLRSGTLNKTASRRLKDEVGSILRAAKATAGD